MTAARPGTVYLVGAGPGDPGLLTVRGRALLEDCDAIVHDALAPPELLRYRAEGQGAADIHYAGKRGGDARSTAQGEIHALLIRLARAGKSVVRLKGGDPFVFGRGGEEAEALAEAKVPFEIVPGVTAGIAGPAYAGIPVTHRGMATAVTFVTGHEDPSKGATQTDWKALVAARGTIVLYMGVGRLDDIARELVTAGMSGDTPAAAIERATTPAQRVIEATVATIAERVGAAGLGAPLLIVIGAVVGLRGAIRWYDATAARPLLGQRVLITRAIPKASRLTEPLQALGAIVRELPAVRVEHLPADHLVDALDRLGNYQHLVFTSQTAVEIVWEAIRARGRDARALAGVTISAIGPATATALLDHGIGVDIVPERFVAEGLLDAMRGRSDLAGRRVLYPCAAGAREVLPDGLRQLGAIVEVVPIYRSVPDVQGVKEITAAVQSQALDLVILTSASAARAYAESVGRELVGRIPAASIGPVTTAAAEAAGVPVRIEASESTLPALIDAIARSMRTHSTDDTRGPIARPASEDREARADHAIEPRSSTQ